ncbi:MAG: GNAT family N-acetyltransferase [Gammaproteobacteria bacterium]|nr:GNAT family N-acetyltransferase [Gammaproteobacteria bacterium]
MAALPSRDRINPGFSKARDESHRAFCKSGPHPLKINGGILLVALRAKLFDHFPMNLELHSERLVLTPFTPDDLDLSLQLWTDPAVLRYAGKAMSESAIRKCMPKWTRRGGNGCIGIWTISDRKTREKYGSVALLPMPIENSETDYSSLIPGEMPDADIEVGYFLKRSAWGCGYATEACRRLLQFAFEESPLKEVVATFHKDNQPSRNVLQKAGFTDRGTMQCYGDVGVNFRITREEWLKLQSN